MKMLSGLFRNPEFSRFCDGRKDRAPLGDLNPLEIFLNPP